MASPAADLKSDERIAIFSEDRDHRFLLKRKNLAWSDSVCLFIMLNPSYANEVRNDNTVSRCCRFTSMWGFGQLWVCNIFSLRSVSPKVLYNNPTPTLPENDGYIRNALKAADRVICAWGNHGALYGRGDQVLDIIEEVGNPAFALGFTSSGQPKHPLARGKAWIPYDAELWTI